MLNRFTILTELRASDAMGEILIPTVSEGFCHQLSVLLPVLVDSMAKAVVTGSRVFRVSWVLPLGTKGARVRGLP